MNEKFTQPTHTLPETKRTEICWRKFEQTGSVEAFLLYLYLRKAKEPATLEALSPKER